MSVWHFCNTSEALLLTKAYERLMNHKVVDFAWKVFPYLATHPPEILNIISDFDLCYIIKLIKLDSD